MVAGLPARMLQCTTIRTGVLEVEACYGTASMPMQLNEAGHLSGRDRHLDGRGGPGGHQPCQQ